MGRQIDRRRRNYLFKKLIERNIEHHCKLLSMIQIRLFLSKPVALSRSILLVVLFNHSFFDQSSLLSRSILSIVPACHLLLPKSFPLITRFLIPIQPSKSFSPIIETLQNTFMDPLKGRRACRTPDHRAPEERSRSHRFDQCGAPYNPERRSGKGLKLHVQVIPRTQTH